MKRILITGKNSYVGNSFAEWVSQYPGKYEVEKISLRTDDWKKMNFSKYDVVLHVAGIAHVSRNPKMEQLYYKVNRDLTIEIANKAKSDGVKQFIFMSSIIVYGDGVGKDGLIDEKTIPKPRDFYGMSKLQAEEGLVPLDDDNYKIAIVRPPMIYGKESKGNFPKLSKLARKVQIFPDFNNRRSMLHIDNLCEFLRLIMDNEESGLYFPQNSEYVKTTELVKVIADVYGNKIYLTKMFNPILRLLINRVNIINKLFGNLVYDQEVSFYKDNYQIYNLRDSIMKTELNKNTQSKIDLLILSDNSLQSVGGEQESTKIIIKGISDYLNIGVIQPGIVIDKIPKVNYYELTKKIRIKHLIKNPISFLLYILRVRNIIKNENPKIIHTQAQVSFFIVSLLKKLNLIPKNIFFIHTERGLYPKYSIFFRRLFIFFMNELNTLVTTTNFNLQYWKKALTEKRVLLKYEVIENTAGQLFEVYDESLEKKGSNFLTIGFAGRYTEWKNWPLAVEIIEKLNKKIENQFSVKMAVGCLDDKSEKSTNEMFNKLTNLLGKRFDGKVNIDLEEMDKFYYDVDIFILTSKDNTESFGRTLIEAMSRKTVVLTTNAGGSVEVVGNNDNVLNDSDEFVEKILYYYSNQEIMMEEKEKNLKSVKERYSFNNNINKHKELYNAVIKSERD